MEVSHKGTQTLAGVKKKLCLAAFAIIYVSVGGGRRGGGAAACSQLTVSLSLFINFKGNNEKHVGRPPLTGAACQTVKPSDGAAAGLSGAAPRPSFDWGGGTV